MRSVLPTLVYALLALSLAAEAAAILRRSLHALWTRRPWRP